MDLAEFFTKSAIHLSRKEVQTSKPFLQILEAARNKSSADSDTYRLRKPSQDDFVMFGEAISDKKNIAKTIPKSPYGIMGPPPSGLLNLLQMFYNIKCSRTRRTK